MTEEARLSPEERTALRQQYARVHASVQETFDSSVRALAAGGVAVTVTIATAAVERFDGWGWAALLSFLGSLACNVGSYVTAQKDMRARLALVRKFDVRGREETVWTTRTFWLNVGAGVALVVGGLFLAAFVAASLDHVDYHHH
jgi:hypothetical protein